MNMTFFVKCFYRLANAKVHCKCESPRGEITQNSTHSDVIIII